MRNRIDSTGTLARCHHAHEVTRRLRPSRSPHASSNQLMATDNGDNIVEKRTNSVVHNNVFCSAPCAPTGDLMFFKEHPEVGILYSDLVGWTTLSSKIEPKTAFRALHTVFSMLDCVTDSLGLYKYETGERGAAEG